MNTMSLFVLRNKTNMYLLNLLVKSELFVRINK
nr:MAG TPA: hypothetical protein [Caudoviricetes sp.]